MAFLSIHQSFNRKSTLLRVIVSFFFLAFGAFIFGVVLTQSIQNIIGGGDDAGGGGGSHPDSDPYSLMSEPYSLMIRRKTCGT